MTALLLAAGQGTRLRPYTDDRPKCLVELAGVSLLERHVAVLRAGGIRDIVIVTGYEGHQIQIPGATVVRNEEFATTNMVVSLMAARPQWHAPLLVAYTDIVYEPAVLQQILAYQGDCGVVVDLEWDAQFRDRFGAAYTSEAEELVLNDDGSIATLGSKITDLGRVQGQYIGLMKFSAKTLEHIARLYDDAMRAPDAPWMRGRNIRAAYMTDLLQRLIDDGVRVDAVPIRRGWIEVDSAADLELYRERIASAGRLPYFDPGMVSAR